MGSIGKGFTYLAIFIAISGIIHLITPNDKSLTGHTISEEQDRDEFGTDGEIFLKKDEIYQDTTENDVFSHTKELHWNHMPLTYNYDEECEFKLMLQNGSHIKMRDEEIIGQIERGLDFITKRTNSAITFKKVNDEIPDIKYICDSSNRRDYFSVILPDDHTVTIGEAQIYTYQGTNIFAPGEVYLIGLGKEGCTDTKPIIVIHETLHMLGLEHRNYVGDIMHRTIREDCKAEISKKHLDYLWNIYDPKGIYKPYKSKYNCEESYYSCADFDIQKDAQEVLEFCGLEKDIHDLDTDKDGLACENLS